MTNEAESLKAKLRQVDDLAAKGLMRAEEAEEARAGLRKRLLEAVIPDEPAPRIPWRARLWAMVAMVVLVGSLAAYLLSNRAGMGPVGKALLDAREASAAQRAAAQEQTFEKLRAQKPAGASGAMSSAAAATSAPLLAGRIALDTALAARVAPDDALFIVVRLPDDPAGLPLAAVRRRAGELPLAFELGAEDLVGDPRRFAQARRVVVTARVSKSGAGLARAGDLAGATAPVAPGASGVDIVVDRIVPAP